MEGDFSIIDEVIYVIDCRFGYEFEGGHIKGAKNIQTPKDLEELFLDNPITDKKVTLVFHCEFSNTRASKM